MQISVKEINRLAIPAIISGIAEPIISLVDTFFVGQLGTEALAGVGIATSFFLFIIWLLAQTKTAVSAIVASYYGKEKLEKLIPFLPQALLLVVLLGSGVYFLTTLNMTPIFKFYEAKGMVLENCISYYQIRAMGIPIVLITFVLFGTFRGVQNTSWAMRISLIGASCNIVLDYILIMGIDGVIPSFGIQGAAWASFASQCLMLILAIYFLYKKTIFKLFFFSYSLHPELPKLFGLSFTLVLRTLSLNVAYILGLKFATSYSDQHSAAHTIAMNLWLFASFFIDGFANAGNALGGKYLGAERKDLIYPLGVKLVKISVGISLILAACFAILYPFIASFFKAEPDVTTIFNSFFWLIILSQPINAMAFALDGVFKGMGRGKLLMLNLVIATFLIFCPIIYFLDYLDWKMYAVWIAFIGFMLSRALHLWLTLRKEFMAYS